MVTEFVINTFFDVLYFTVNDDSTALFINCSISDPKCDFESDFWSTCGYRTMATIDGLAWDFAYEKEILGYIIYPGPISLRTHSIMITVYDNITLHFKYEECSVHATDILIFFSDDKCIIPDSKIHGANMGPTWVLSAPDGPHEPCFPMDVII